MLRKILVSVCLGVIFTGILTVFWHQEFIYALPTPLPAAYKAVPIGTRPGILTEPMGKPGFLHFFNPDCPCSRFNIAHFKSLVHEYGNRTAFMVIVQTKDPKWTPEKIREKYDLDIPVIIDNNKAMAEACGVYSTPQAAILDKDGKLFYRGNYNKARFCTDKKSDFARMALDSLLRGKTKKIEFGVLARRAYGCTLPVCN